MENSKRFVFATIVAVLIGACVTGMAVTSRYWPATTTFATYAAPMDMVVEDVVDEVSTTPEPTDATSLSNLVGEWTLIRYNGNETLFDITLEINWNRDCVLSSPYWTAHDYLEDNRYGQTNYKMGWGISIRYDAANCMLITEGHGTQMEYARKNSQADLQRRFGTTYLSALTGKFKAEDKTILLNCDGSFSVADLEGEKSGNYAVSQDSLVLSYTNKETHSMTKKVVRIPFAIDGDRLDLIMDDDYLNIQAFTRISDAGPVPTPNEQALALVGTWKSILSSEDKESFVEFLNDGTFCGVLNANETSGTWIVNEYGLSLNGGSPLQILVNGQFLSIEVPSVGNSLIALMFSRLIDETETSSGLFDEALIGDWICPEMNNQTWSFKGNGELTSSNGSSGSFTSIDSQLSISEGGNVVAQFRYSIDNDELTLVDSGGASIVFIRKSLWKQYNDLKKSLPGAWKSKIVGFEETDQDYTIRFKNDGTYVVSMLGAAETGEYTLENNILHLGPNRSMIVSIESNNLTLSDGVTTTVFSRIPENYEALIGAWNLEGMQDCRVIFYSDGVYSTNVQGHETFGTYDAGNGELQYAIGNQSGTASFIVNGKSLKIEENGYTLVFNRDMNISVGLSLIGKWEFADHTIGEITFSIDGTYSIILPIFGESEKGNFSTSGTKLSYGETDAEYAIDGDTLTISTVEQKTLFDRRKNRLIGSWIYRFNSESSVILTFSDDGTFITTSKYGDESTYTNSGIWTSTDDLLFLDGIGYSYSTDGKTLTLSFEGMNVVYYRYYD